MEIAFLHIGLPKTATTYMQEVWLYDSSYCLSYKGTIEFIKKLREEVRINNLNFNQDINIELDHRNRFSQKLIVSNEGFSSAFLNEPQYQDKLPQYLKYSSQVMGQLNTENLLIVVREPISWIKSLFNQSIKEGNSNSSQEFVNQQIDLLKSGLNLEYIVECYENHFSNIMIIPFEILKNNKDKFWGMISERFELPVVDYNAERSNQSFDFKRLFLLAKLNELNGVLYNVLRDSDDYKKILSQEKDSLLEYYSIIKKWIPRRFIRFAKEEEIDEIYDLFNISDIPASFLEFNLPNQLLDVINTNYIGFLESKIDKQYIDLYRKKVKNHQNI